MYIVQVPYKYSYAPNVIKESVRHQLERPPVKLQTGLSLVEHTRPLADVFRGEGGDLQAARKGVAEGRVA